jgi:hypothetical protein
MVNPFVSDGRFFEVLAEVRGVVRVHVNNTPHLIVEALPVRAVSGHDILLEASLEAAAGASRRANARPVLPRVANGLDFDDADATESA